MKNVPLISVGFDGYSLAEAVKHLAKTGTDNICLCALDELTQHVVPERSNPAEWQQVKTLLENNGLQLYGLEGHTDLSNKDNIDKIKKRMDFTRFMGGRYFDTCAGPAGREKTFIRNLEEISVYADELDLFFCLETHGDIIGPAKDAAWIFDRLRSDRVRLCYDPANVYFYSRGSVDPIEDLPYAMEYLELMHFKGVRYDEAAGEWRFPSMNDAPFVFDDIFRILDNYSYQGMVALENEMMFGYREGKGLAKDPPWRPDEIVDAYRQEMKYLSEHLDWLL
jgi:sugar phosphate isomerase/epimerase